MMEQMGGQQGVGHNLDHSFNENDERNNDVNCDNVNESDKVPWYLIDVESNQYKGCSFIMTMLIIYC